MLSPYFQVAFRALRGETAILPRKMVWRDWIYSRDAADGIVRALRAVAPGHRLYHLASGLDWQGTFTGWCSMLQDKYPAFSWRFAADGDEPNISFLLARDRAPMDVSRMMHDLGFRPRFGPVEAHRDYAQWLADHEAWLLAKKASDNYPDS